MARFADVILPLPLDSCYTYSIPELLSGAQVGCRVVVPLGSRKFYTGIIYRIHDRMPEGCQVKPIEMLLDERPVVEPKQLEFWNWIASYYLCSLGDVMNAALPSGMKLESETQVAISEDFMGSADLTPSQARIVDILLSNGRMSLQHLAQAMKLKNILPQIRPLIEAGHVQIHDEIMGSYRPKTVHILALEKGLRSEERMQETLESLKRSKAQQSLLLEYMDRIGLSESGDVKDWYVERGELLRHASHSIIKALVDKGIMVQEDRQVDRAIFARKGTDNGIMAPNPLSVEQAKALEEIREGFLRKDVCLLHGVTSSGKTEIYIHLIKEAIDKGQQVLYLLPEIALTTQITERLQRFFGESLGIYHSKFPDSWRVDVYNRQISERPFQVILGVRSSLMMPMRNLGLVIVDEEHETTYKQQDPAPRYHARDAAIVLAHMFGAKVLLGSATPSLESWYNATQAGKYHLVSLKTRFKGILMPRIQIVDTKEAQRRRQMKGIFSPELLEAIDRTIREGGQVILFQNRRGYAPMVECPECGWVPKCQNCDVSLTYHKATGRMTCHYCGYTVETPKLCPSCSSSNLKDRGFGTEKIEEDIARELPGVRTLRLDLDTARSRGSYEEILGSFQRHEADILIGTQMVSKGLDFGKVRLVGILNADTMLNYPDFRAMERAYQLMAQVSGRAGRKGSQGLVLLQTRSTHHPIIRQVQQNDYESMSQGQLQERRQFRYPPFFRIIAIYMKSRKEDELDVYARILTERLIQVFQPERVLGPDKPAIGRVQGQHIRKILIKLENGASPAKAKQVLRQLQERILRDEHFKSLQIFYDVDPY